VCEYYPPGNVNGENNRYFKENVKKQTKGKDTDTVETGVTSGACTLSLQPQDGAGGTCKYTPFQERLIPLGPKCDGLANHCLEIVFWILRIPLAWLLYNFSSRLTCA
jgi:hypothetical protein